MTAYTLVACPWMRFTGATAAVLFALEYGISPKWKAVME